MTPTLPPNFSDGAQLRAGESRVHAARGRQLEDLPPLPEDCWPEMEARPVSPPEEPARASLPGPARDPGSPAVAATQDRRAEPRSEASRPGFETLLRSLVGCNVTVVDPESFEEATVGHKIRAAIYRAELLELGEDYVVLSGEFVHRGAAARNGSARETIRHYVPTARIKRVSLLSGGAILHL